MYPELYNWNKILNLEITLKYGMCALQRYEHFLASVLNVIA